MTGIFLIPFCKKLFYLSAHACPFRRLTPPPSPYSGTAYVYYSFLLWQLPFNTACKTQFTRAVILERRAESEWWQKKEHNLTLSEESGSGYRKTHLILTFFAQILTAPVGRVWRLTHFYSVALLLEKWFACHHSTPYFFILLFLTAFYDRSRMTGIFLIPFCKKLFFISAHTCPFR